MVVKVHAEIEYINNSGKSIHSDICPPNCYACNMQDKEYRAFIHECLDEWIDHSNGTGQFYISGETNNDQ